MGAYGASIRRLYQMTTLRGSTYTTIMELGPQHHAKDNFLEPNSVTVVDMDPLSQLTTSVVPKALVHPKPLVKQVPLADTLP